MPRAVTVLGMVLIGFAVAISAVAAEAQDLTEMSLQDLMNIEIFSASKLLQKASEAPASQQTEPFSQMLIYENGQKINAKGMELQLTRKDANGLQMQLSYTTQRAVDAESHESFSNSPRQMAKASLNAPLLGENSSPGLRRFIWAGAGPFRAIRWAVS